MSCNLDTITAADQDVSYLAGTEISKNSSRQVALNDNPVNLFGATLVTHVKKRATDTESKAVAIFKTNDDTLQISGTDYDILTWYGIHQLDQDVYYYDTWWEEEGEYIEKGKFIVFGNVTRL